jgi:pimeloyl-ACP methyl ester carboxylesterase
MPLPSPVIFLPGIMGSALRDEYPVSPENVWSVLKAATKSYERITLHPDGIAQGRNYEVVEPARVVKDQLFEVFYRDLIEELRHNLTLDPDEPVPVFPFAYDWRQPLAAIEDQLAAFIDEVINRTSLLRHYNNEGYTPKTGKVSLVAHSMGGMIVAGYVESRGLKCIDRVATLATPFRGSLESVAKTTIGVGGFTFSSGGSREREAARVTPALYHLLPGFEGAVTAAPGLSKNIFRPEAWQPGILDTLATFIRRFGLTPTDSNKMTDDERAVKLLARMLNDAKKYQARLERLTLPDSKRWLSIVGVNERTRLAMTIQPDGRKKPFFVIEEPADEWKSGNKVRTGDGTVPYLGARAAFVPVTEVVCVTPGDFGFFEFRDKILSEVGFHSAIPNMNLVQRLVTSHLLGRKERSPAAHPSPEIDPKLWDPPIAGLAP